VNWEAISAIGQLLGALAVVISLIYLAREVGSNARATRQAAMRSMLDSLNQFSQQITTHADLAELRKRGFDDFESLEGADRVRFISYMHALFRTLEDVYYQHLEGIWIHACGVGSKWSFVTSTHFLEFRPGGVHTRVGSGRRSLRSSLISNSKQPPGMMTSSQHVYDVRSRKDKRGFDLISDALPFGRLWYGTVDDAIGYGQHFSRSYDAVICVYYESGKHKAEFKKW
jgi:hypothetical protein